jgi:uncharacterized protein (TIGR03083 family)
MEPADHLSALRSGADALLEAAKGALDRPVPTCPGWDVGELVVHVALIWEWAAEIVATGQRAELGEAPSDRSEARLLGWAAERADRVLATLREADPGSDCWTFGLPRSRQFWIRRQALETTMHAYDAQGAVGVPLPIDADVAADGVDEYLSVFVPRWLSRHPGAWDGQSLHLHRSDGDGEWLVRLGPHGAVSSERSHTKADAAVRGPAGALWLWCCNRATLDELGLDVYGDRTVTDRWTAEIAF